MTELPAMIQNGARGMATTIGRPMANRMATNAPADGSSDRSIAMVAWNTNQASRIAILAGARTPMAKAGTALREVHASELARVAIQEALYRANCPAEALDEVILGNVVMPADAANLARVSAIWAGVPREVPGITLQRNCASGMEAVSEAAMRIRGGL